MVNLLLTSALDLFNQYKSIRGQTSNSGKALLGPSSSTRQRNEQVLLLLPCLLAQGMQVASFYCVRVGVCSEVGLEGWLRWAAHSFGGICAEILCSTLLLLLTPSFCSLLFKIDFGLCWSSCIFLSRICPNCACMQLFFSSVQLLSRVRLFATPWTAARQASLSITNSRSLLKLMFIKLVMPFILCHPLLLLPSIFPRIRVFSSESALSIRWPKYWSFSFNISPSNEHSGLISFRMDWLDLLEVQGTLKSLLQHHSSKASILRCSAFFTVKLSQPYMTTGKTIALTRLTFVGKVMSLLSNMLSRFPSKE